MNKNKLLKFLLIIIVILFLIKICPIVLQNDTFYDVVLGKRYINEGMFKIDDYSIHDGLVYQTHHYLVCIISYIVYNLFSFNGLYILEIILGLIIAYLFYLISKDMIKNKFISYGIIFFQMIALSSFISLRAQMYSYIIFLLEILFIEKYLNNNRRKYLVIITLLPLILINFHSGVIYFYFIIMATYLLNGLNINAGRLISDKRMGKKQVKALIITSIIGVFITIINPYGIDGLTYGLKTLNSPYINNHIAEFAHYNFSLSLGKPIAIYVLTLFICLLFSEKKIKIHEILLFLGTIFMTFTSIRHFSLLIITSIVLIPHIDGIYNVFKRIIFDIVIESNRVKVILSLFIIMFLLPSIINREYDFVPDDVYPKEAIKYIKNNIDSKDHIFNEYSFGSYLMFNNIKVFIDSRCDLYNMEYNDTTVFKDYTDLFYNNLDYREIVFKYNIKYFFVRRNDYIVSKLLYNSKNEIIYQDKLSVIVKIVDY
jgi:hypothetical protein